MNPILFLDVDGVLNHEAIFLRNIHPPLDPELVARLNRLCEATGAQVVLSSSWRADAFSNGLEDDLRATGALRHAHPTDPRTKWLNAVSNGGVIMARVRGAEITEWLSRHPEVTPYAIVDDSSDMLPEQMPRFVQTDFQAGGLTEHHAKALEALLLPPPPAGERG